MQFYIQGEIQWEERMWFLLQLKFEFGFNFMDYIRIFLLVFIYFFGFCVFGELLVLMRRIEKFQDWRIRLGQLVFLVGILFVRIGIGEWVGVLGRQLGKVYRRGLSLGKDGQGGEERKEQRGYASVRGIIFIFFFRLYWISFFYLN